MQEILEQIRSVVRGLWLKKRYIIIVSWLIAVVGWMAITTMPDKYSASARVYVDTQSLLKPLLRGMTVSNNPDEQVRLMVKTLLSRPNLQKILRMVDLDILASNQQETNQLINQLSTNITLARTARDNLFTITYTGTNREKAQQVVEAVLKVFVDNTVGQSRDETLIAKQFFSEQIAEYEKRLTEAESRLTDFKQKNGSLISKAGTGNYYATLQKYESQLNAARLAHKEAESQLIAARQRLAGETPSFGLLTPTQKRSFATSYDARINTLNNSLDQQSLKFTANHPDIKELKSRIRYLKRLRDKEIAEMVEVSSTVGNDSLPLNQNPVFQEMKLSAIALENKLVGINVRKSDLEKKVADLKGKIHLVPEVESQLTSLNRDYNVTKQKYEQLLKRRETARLGEQAGQSVDDIQFKVIDPPRALEEATGPNRILFYTMVLIAGLGAGITTAFLMSQINTVIMSPFQLTQLTGLPVLGTVSNTQDVAFTQSLRNKNLVFFSLVGLLLTIYCIIVALELSNSLLPQIRELARGFLA